WASLTIATTTLTDKASYNWDVRAEDTSNAVSDRYPSETTTCRVTIDASAPPAPDVTSEDFPEATPDGGTWSKVKFGTTGSVTFESAGATKFIHSFSSQEPRTATATGGKATVTDLKPRNAGPNSLEVVAYDAVGNPSVRTVYYMYVMPSDVADAPGDLTGDKMADLLLINGEGRLRTCPSQPNGGLHTCLVSSYSTGNKLDPTGHWFDAATNKTSLIAKYADVYPGDGTTDLFVRHYDGSMWLYPGDGYGSFNVDDRIKILLPSNTPATSTWTQMKAVGDITGDKLPDLAIRAGSAFWLLSGYTGASFLTATSMDTANWSTAEIVNIADVNLDGAPDMTFRKPDTGIMYIRHGKPGTVAGSVDLNSLKSAAASLKGVDTQYGTNWTAANITAIVGIPDVNGDKIPDMWARRGTDGVVKVYYPNATDTGAAKDAIITANWAAMKGFA
ncbi:FG-GAP repeat domain-containing protein, partial [Actinoplanes sp. GCM10030250]|uniref:FG-GAP repeat domain-containing protein n=1 Tax=Actinoplanes sp. GCM10030250 TaxID=3273376 RepID=UPI003622842D